jgi:hypothetical protein
MAAMLQNYEADHNGDLSNLVTGSTDTEYAYQIYTPPAGTPNLGSYVGKLGPEVGNVYVINTMGEVNIDTYSGSDMHIYPGSLCPHTTRTTTPTSSDAAVTVYLSNGTFYCQDI